MRGFLSRISVYPVKSLTGISHGKTITVRSNSGKGATLSNDRLFYLIRRKGKLDSVEWEILNAKKEARLHQLNLSWGTPSGAGPLILSFKGQRIEFSKNEASFDSVNDFLSEMLGYEVRIKMQSQGGQPDDTEHDGPTIVSVATLKFIAAKFDWSLSECRARFRSNLELDGNNLYPFWEESLIGKTLMIGKVAFTDLIICRRCPVPARDSSTGETTIPYQDFVKAFIDFRKATLPADVDPANFLVSGPENYYRLTLNSKIPETSLYEYLEVGAAASVL